MIRCIPTLLLLIVPVAHSLAQSTSWQPPAESQRCPSQWGAGDERGSANLMTPEVVLGAARLIRTGEVIELGHVLHEAMPFFGGRIFNMQIKRSDVFNTANSLRVNEEMVTTELGQVGTQFDGLAHQAIGPHLYNCVDMEAAATRTGFTKNGVEKSGALVARGVLIDVAAARGVEMLGEREEITAQMLEDALAKQKLSLRRGDAVIIHTGWGKLWEKDNARYYRTTPGIGIQAAEWLARQNPMLVGSDTCCVEVMPNPDPKLLAPAHQVLLVANGIYMLESMKLDELVAKQVHEFAFIVQPLKLKGATGSAVAPIAIH